MTSDRQGAANRKNAAKSTGPTSAAGKRRSSRNARRHGLNTPIESADLQHWFKVVTNDASALLPISPDTDWQRAALALAEAEAHLDRCRRAEAVHLERLARHHLTYGRRTLSDFMAMTPDELFNSVESLEFMIQNRERQEREDGEDRQFEIGAMKILLVEARRQVTRMHHDTRVFRKHRRSAESRRSQALLRWTVLNIAHELKTNPFSTKG